MRYLSRCFALEQQQDQAVAGPGPRSAQWAAENAARGVEAERRLLPPIRLRHGAQRMPASSPFMERMAQLELDPQAQARRAPRLGAGGASAGCAAGSERARAIDAWLAQQPPPMPGEPMQPLPTPWGESDEPADQALQQDETFGPR